MALLATKIIRLLGIIIKSSGIAWDTDGSGDIGTATHRPRDIHLSRNLAAGGTGKVGTTFGVGGATPATSGAGLTFPAAASASADANTLDDYEEGTWTPTLASPTNCSSLVVTAGRYTKIGRLVYIQAYGTLEVTAPGAVQFSLTLPVNQFADAERSLGVAVIGGIVGYTGDWTDSDATRIGAIVAATVASGAQSWNVSLVFHAA